MTSSRRSLKNSFNDDAATRPLIFEVTSFEVPSKNINRSSGMQKRPNRFGHLTGTLGVRVLTQMKVDLAVAHCERQKRATSQSAESSAGEERINDYERFT